MNYFKVLAVASLLATISNAFSYDVVDRYKLIDDKLKTEQMLRPIGHDFFLDIGAALNMNARDFIDDIKKANDFSNADAAAKLANAQSVLAKYDKTEQTVKINLALGFPIFRFSIGDLKIQPNLRVFADVGANIGVRSEPLTPAKLLDLINVDIPVELKNKILAYNYTAGKDLLDPVGDNSFCTSLSTPEYILGCTQNRGKYFYPSNTNLPDMLLFAKVDGRVGLYNDYTYGEHFFGNWNIYGLSRTDIFQRVNSDMIAKGTKIELPKKKNTQMALQTDYRLGYMNSNYRIFASVEDLKIAQMKDREVGSKELSYGYDPLMRIHADALYKYSVLSINPFLGLHKRKGYGFSDGIYVGADAGAHVWGDRIGLQLRGMFDKQYITISPRMKLWLLQLEYSVKSPVKSMDGDVKLSAIQSIDLRLFF
ncbi:MAG: hypothetical protein H7235_10205 [Bdellovibrionaceae bacterium]|nr:hypothetical protein [Pseudobdellovibrionaceae bacterium]